MKTNINKKQILIVVATLLLLAFGVYQLVLREKTKKSDITNQDNTNIQNSYTTWDAETASLKEYASYEEMEQEQDKEFRQATEKYNNAIKGTIVEQVQNIAIPAYLGEEPSVHLQQGEVEVREPKSDDFPDGIFSFGAYLEKDVNSFAIGDFNNDGLDDVAHIITYTGGGSGMFYNLTIFINDHGKLKYLTQEELGDRVIIRSVKYKSGLFTVDMITQGEGDDFKGYCCPNVPATIRFKLENNKLILVKE